MRALAIALYVVLATATAVVSAADDWTPPPNPDPSAVLEQADDDAKRGNYEIALAKHLWFHENALRLQPSLAGVRLSFALSSWLELGKIYPPALDKMRAIRDDLEAKIKDENRIRVRFEDYHDFTAFNRTLDQQKRTAELFKWLGETDPEDAVRLYDVSEPALIQEKEYALCSKYLKPDKVLAKIRQQYELLVESSKLFGKDEIAILDFRKKSFVNRSAILVAVLAATDRKKEANQTVDELSKFVDDVELLKRLKQEMIPALEGEVPEPWQYAANEDKSDKLTANAKSLKPLQKEVTPTPAVVAWTPPPNPDPQAISRQAKDDTQRGNYEIALAKHLWFHENALQLQPSLSGVRLSFALSSWLELAEVYPPALDKMREIRDGLEVKIKDENRVRFEDYHEFTAFNRTLRKEQRTAELFKWLADAKPAAAKRMYGVSEAALIKQKEYKLCAEYIEPSKALIRIRQQYEHGEEASKRFGERHRDYVKNKFVNSATTLVAILVVTGEEEEANKVAEELSEITDDADLLRRLQKEMIPAFKGKVPNPWP